MSEPERHWLHVFATFAAGGPQVRAAAIMDRLGGRCRHTVVAMDGATGCADRVAGDVRLDLLPPPAGRGPRAVSRAAAGLLRGLRPDLLLTYNFGAVEALLGAWRAGFAPVVHHEEGFGSDEIERLLPRRNWLRRVALWGARAVVVPSRRLQGIARRTWWQPARRVHWLPNGVDLQRFRAAPRAGGGRDVVVGCVGAFRPVKNHPLLLRAWARSRARERARLVLVGDGPEREGCERLAGDLGVEVEFRGAVADTAEVYRGLDVFAASSRTEQMPIVVLEAMASGLPVVATDVGDVAEMVAPENRGLIVAPDDEAELAAALDRVVEDAGLRARAGGANRRRCEERFEVQECLGRYVELFERVAAGWGKRR